MKKSDQTAATNTTSTTVQLTLTTQEAQAILTVLGQLPTQTNAYPLYLKVQSQLESSSTSLPTMED